LKPKLFIWTIGTLVLLFSCGQPNGNNAVCINDTSQIKINQTEKALVDTTKEIENQWFKDRLRLDKVLQDALTKAFDHINNNEFKEEYDLAPDSIPITVNLDLDYHFTKTNPHLIIKRYDPDNIYIDIYIKTGTSFERVASHEKWLMTYVNDTIRDINGDGNNDFMVNWHGHNGCCLKAFSDVYLLRQNQKSFSEKFEFINPTFSPNEKLIRGVCYGHPGETEMYKYKWNGEKLDTIEYVSYQKNNMGEKTGKIILSTDQPYRENCQILKILNSIPIEYKQIEDYDWFTGYTNN
jgi:hypothetical protein